MKKILLFLMSVILFASCNGCDKSQENVTPKDSIGVVLKDSAVAVIDVSHAIALDRQAMYINYKDDYRWFETEILLPGFMDSDSATSAPEMVVNILQSFWIENYALNDEVIKLNYTEAWDRMMQTNYPKPHSKHVTLRNPVGPVAVNTQWIFGNIHEQIWIDAVTGDAKNSNPAFPEEKGFKMPLGEWP
jgi:hypothetical protein